MSLFEYVAVAASLVCSFIAVRLLGGIASTLVPERRYWVHTAWVFIALLSITLNWWVFWSYREVQWDYLRFVVALVPLALFYVVATLLVPDDAHTIRSWRTHFFEVRVRFFGLNLLYLASLTATTVVLLGHPVVHARRLLPGAISAVFIAGMIWENPKLQGAIVIGYLALTAVSAVVFLGPRSFGKLP